MPLTPQEIGDARQFAGYPVAAAVAYQGLDIQGASAALNAVLAALTDVDLIDVRATLASLRLLDGDLFSMRDSLDTKKAAVWERNPAEAAERVALFLSMRRRFCAFLGVAPGPGLFVDTTASGAVYPVAMSLV